MLVAVVVAASAAAALRPQPQALREGGGEKRPRPEEKAVGLIDNRLVMALIDPLAISDFGLGSRFPIFLSRREVPGRPISDFAKKGGGESRKSPIFASAADFRFRFRGVSLTL